jgi:hypothetical protein
MAWRDTFLRYFGPGLLSGITAGDWARVPRDNHFAVSRTDRRRRATVQGRQPPRQLAGVHQDPQAADLRRGDRPPLGNGLPPRQHRNPHGPHHQVGPGRGADRRRQGRVCHAPPRVPPALGVTGVGVGTRRVSARRTARHANGTELRGQGTSELRAARRGSALTNTRAPRGKPADHPTIPPRGRSAGAARTGQTGR